MGVTTIHDRSPSANVPGVKPNRLVLEESVYGNRPLVTDRMRYSVHPGNRT
jgi:hypothetical protein